MTFTSISMQEILPLIEDTLKNQTSVSFNVLDPDLDGGYAGHTLVINEQTYIYRGYKAWMDLAELFMCKMLTPKENAYPLVTITYKKLEIKDDESSIVKKFKEKLNENVRRTNKLYCIIQDEGQRRNNLTHIGRSSIRCLPVAPPLQLIAVAFTQRPGMPLCPFR